MPTGRIVPQIGKTAVKVINASRLTSRDMDVVWRIPVTRKLRAPQRLHPPLPGTLPRLRTPSVTLPAPLLRYPTIGMLAVPSILGIVIIQKETFVVSIRRIARGLAASFGCLMVNWMGVLLCGNKDVQVTVIVASMVNARQAR